MPYPDPTSYAQRCIEAATAQGLDPVTERLHLESAHYEVEQTGGFTMVVVVPSEGGTYGITGDDFDDDEALNPVATSWLVVFYPGSTWQTGEDIGTGRETVWRRASLDDIAHIIKEARP